MIINFLDKLTIKKLINLFKIYISYWFSLVFRINFRWGFPISLSLEISGKCNLKCVECPVGQNKLTRKSGNMDFNLFKKTVDEFAPFLSNLILYFQGEPFLNRNIYKMIEYASAKKKIFTCTSTNGHFLNEKNSEKIIKSKLDKIIISMDGTTQKIYEKYRQNGEIKKVIKGIKNLNKQKIKYKTKIPFVVVQFLVFKHNEHQINDITKICKQLKVDKLEIKTAQIYNFKDNTNQIPSINKYSRYKKNPEGVYEIKNKLKNKCFRLWSSAVITWDGNILPCCFDKNAKYKFGNIKNTNFSEINNNKKSRNFRKNLLKNRKNIDICKNCTEGTK